MVSTIGCKDPGGQEGETSSDSDTEESSNTTDTDTGETGEEDLDSCLETIEITGASWEPSDEPGEDPINLDFSLSLDPGHALLDPAADPKRLDPRAGPVSVSGGDAAFTMQVLAKRLAERPDTIWLELYVLSEGELGLADVELELTGVDAQRVWDLGRDPWADPVDEARFVVGHVAPGATGRAVVGIELPVDAGVLDFGVSLTGFGSQRRAANSAPLAISPDGGEVWSPFTDADMLAVVDTSTDTRVDELEIPGRPMGTAITHDGEWVLSAAAGCNQLVVIDRQSRAIVQVLGEDEGIGREPRHVLVSPDDRWAFVSSYVGDSVTALRRVEGGYRVEATIGVDRRPVGMAIDADGSQLFVAHWMPRGPIEDNESWVSRIDLETLALDDEIITEDEANLDRVDCITMIFGPVPPESLTFEGSFNQLAGVFVGPSGGRGVVPSVRIAPFPILEGDPQASGIDNVVTGANSPLHMSELDLREPALADWATLDLMHEITDRSPAFLQCVGPHQINEYITPFKDPMQPGVWAYLGKTAPTSAATPNTTGPARFMAWTPDGRAAFLLGTAADQLIVLNGATMAGTHSEHLDLSGSNPIGMVFTPDGAKAYIAYENTPALGILDTSAYADEPLDPGYVPAWFADGLGGGFGGLLTFELYTVDVNGLPALPDVSEIGSVALVDEDPMDPVMRRGKILFNSSNPNKYPELASSPQATCQACHPGGGTDGAGWPTVEGERRTLPLWGGTGGRGWLHYSATHSSSEEFATIIVEERLGGAGLSEADVHALSSYVAEGVPEVQRPAVDEALAAEGQAVFEATCVSCHFGETYGSGSPTPDHPYGGAAADSMPALFDVGTATDDALIMMGQTFVMLFPEPTRTLFETMRGDRTLGADDTVQQTLGYTPRPDRERGMFKAPSLVNVWESPNYLHDGSLGELREVVDYFDTQLELGLSSDDKTALLEYLKTL